jgi:hypothetical protein
MCVGANVVGVIGVVDYLCWCSLRWCDVSSCDACWCEC